MSTPMIRGYSLRQTARYIETQFDPATREKIQSTLPATVRSQMGSFQPADWYPRDYAKALYRGIAASGTTEQEAYDALVRCGEYIASEATNTFLKLLMKILTPSLFAKKVPDFWSRDQRGGFFEADVSQADDSLIKMRLADVDGYDHIGVISIGWIKFGMVALGKKNVTVKQTGWTLAQPGPNEVRYEVNW